MKIIRTISSTVTIGKLIEYTLQAQFKNYEYIFYDAFTRFIHQSIILCFLVLVGQDKIFSISRKFLCIHKNIRVILEYNY